MNEQKYCAKCGTPAASDARFCESCGAPLAAQPVEGAAATAGPASTYAAPRAEIPYQGVGIRFVALLIDGFILLVINTILLALVPSLGATANWSQAQEFGGFALVPFYAGIVVTLLYFPLLLGRYGQSVGMMAVKIKVVKEVDGSPITYGSAFIRTILLIIDLLFAGLVGAILIWNSDKKQRLGDRVAHTVVVKKL